VPLATSGSPSVGARGAASGASADPDGRLAALPYAALEELVDSSCPPETTRAIAYPPPARTTTAVATEAMRSDSRERPAGRPGRPRPGPVCPGPVCPGPVRPGPVRPWAVCSWPVPGPRCACAAGEAVRSAAAGRSAGRAAAGPAAAGPAG